MSAPIANIVGQRFGARVVVCATDGRSKNRQVIWSWRCDCGATGETTAESLRVHPTCSSCPRPDAAQPHDITGQRFGRLIAVRRLGKKWSVSLWECLCDCGRIRRVGLNNLRAKEHRNAVSCGRCKIKCASCGKRVRKSIRLSITDATRCVRCVRLAGRTRRATTVQGRVCHGCKRTDAQTRWSSKVSECAACNRQADRNGRDTEGRPIARGMRKVVAS